MDVILIFVVIGIIVGAIKKGNKDSYSFWKDYMQGKPYWTDSEGKSKMFKTGKKVLIDFDNECHTIATDKKGNTVDLTEQELITTAERMKDTYPHYIQKWGNNQHHNDKVKGQRYCEWLGDHWKFYVSTQFCYCNIYLDAETGKAVMPTRSQLLIEKLCKEKGVPYNTKEDLQKLIDYYNSIPEWKRKERSLPNFEELFDLKKVENGTISMRQMYNQGIVEYELRRKV